MVIIYIVLDMHPFGISKTKQKAVAFATAFYYSLFIKHIDN